MLLHHHDVDGLGIFESQESEPPRPAGGPITHDGALNDLPILAEITLQGF
jgi:hypothetical protein